MRFLFTVQPTIGHFHAMAPLAVAAREAGHEVAFATGAGFGPVLQRAGFRHFPCGLDFDGSGDVLPTLPEWPEIDRLPLPLPFKQFRAFVLGLGPRMADDVLALARDWRPAAIVRDPLEFGGYVAAEAYGLPYASVMWAFYMDPRTAALDAVQALRRRHGLPDDPGLATFDRHLIVKATPPSWSPPGVPAPPPTARAFRSPPFDLGLGGDLPAWVDALPDRPTVYATLGTSFNHAAEVFRAIIAGLGAEDVNGIVTVGRAHDPAAFEPLPANVRVERFIPQSRLLPRCHAAIFHGGFNSLLSASWNGLPVVVIPQEGGDQVLTARMAEALGLGVAVEGSPPTAETVRAAVRAVLERPAFRRRAQQARTELDALPPLSEAVRRLEEMAGG